MRDDIWINNEQEEYTEDEFYECSCGWFGSDVFIIKEFGMEFYICPDCGGEVF